MHFEFQETLFTGKIFQDRALKNRETVPQIINIFCMIYVQDFITLVLKIDMFLLKINSQMES